ncbi:MAG: hypothetical protein ACFHVJ_18305 [Aestuariibacter sp.]
MQPKRSIRMLAAAGEQNDNQRYLIELVEKILTVYQPQSQYNLTLVPADGYYTYHKIQLVNRGIIDLTIFGAASDPANKAREVPVPVAAGLLGYRVSFVHKDKLQQFNNLNSLEALKQWVACLGKDWKDADIFEFNDLTVNRLSEYELMLKALQVGRCDYFPRAIHEGFIEAENIRDAYPDIRLATEIIIHYPFASHIYIHADDEKLYNDVLQGLKKMTLSGELQAFLQQHFYAQHVFPLSQWQDHHIIELDNPHFSKESYEDWGYWIDLQ